MKFISYSLWGDNKTYTYGMVENVLLAKELYPDWVVRVHYNDTVPSEIIEWINTQDNAETIHHPGITRSAMNMFWRFEDLFIPDAITIIRDSDSRLNQREVDVVNDWLSSDKDFYSCRDNKYHTVPILGGALGSRNNLLKWIPIRNGNKNVNGPQFVFMDGLELMNRFIEQNQNGQYCTDQIFLCSFVYPYILNNSVIYTSHNSFEPFCKHIDPVETGFMGEIIEECPRAAEIFGEKHTYFKREAQYD